MHAIAHLPPRPVEPGDPAVPPPLASILEKALEKDPADRYSSLRDMAVDLRRFGRRASGSSPVLTPVTAVEATLPLVKAPGGRLRRARGLWIAAGVAVALGAAFLLQRALAPGRHEAHPPRATRFLVQTESQEEGPAFSPDGRAFAYASNTRGPYDVYYRLIAGGAPVRLSDGDEDSREPCFTRDGTRVFFTRGELGTPRTAVWSVSVLGGAARKVLDGGDSPSFSADGKRLLFRRWRGDRTALYLAEPDGGGEIEVFTAPHGEITGARLSPDGKSVAFLWLEVVPGHLGDVWIVDTAGGAPRRLTNDRRDVAGHVEFLPDGSEVLFCSVRSGVGNIWMVPPKGGVPRNVTTGSGRTLSPSVSPDGKSLLLETERVVSDAWEYTLGDGAGRALTSIGTVWAPSRLPDGRLLFCDWSRGEENLDIVVEDGKGARTMIAEGTSPRASSDGRRIFFTRAFGGGRSGLFAVDLDGGPARALTDGAADDESPDPTPDGRSVVFTRASGGTTSVLLLPVTGGVPRVLFSGEASNARAGRDAAVFRTCLPEGCGVYAAPYAGGAPRLLVPDGRWPALGPGGHDVYAAVGPKNAPALVKVPLAGGTPVKLLEFNRDKKPQFWAVFTMDVTANEAAAVVTHQNNDHDVVLLEGVLD
jgi:Tol biopolymer transport system component